MTKPGRLDQRHVRRRGRRRSRRTAAIGHDSASLAARRAPSAGPGRIPGAGGDEPRGDQPGQEVSGRSRRRPTAPRMRSVPTANGDAEQAEADADDRAGRDAVGAPWPSSAPGSLHEAERLQDVGDARILLLEELREVVARADRDPSSRVRPASSSRRRSSPSVDQGDQRLLLRVIEARAAPNDAPPVAELDVDCPAPSASECRCPPGVPARRCASARNSPDLICPAIRRGPTRRP